MANNTEQQQIAAKVKQEKIDPEIEEKIKLLQDDVKHKKLNGNTETVTNNVNVIQNGNSGTTEISEDVNDSDAMSDEEEEEEQSEQQDEKKNIEPIKSSNEILAELFKVFNAAPPTELLNDKKLIAKVHKHKKHKKEKKKKRKKSKAASHNSDSEASLSDAHKTDGHRHKKKKKREKKHKEHRDRSKEHKRKDHEENLKIKEDTSKEKLSRHKSNDSDCYKRIQEESNKNEASNGKISFKINKENKQFETRKGPEVTQKSIRKEPEKPKNSFYNGFHEHVEIKKENGQKQQKTNKCDSNDNISEISLSDEETYLREKEEHNAAEPKRTRYEHQDLPKSSHSSNYSRSNNSFYAGAERTHREDDRDKRYYRHSMRRHHRSRTRSRSRTKSRSRSVDLGIDKKRLLEIARKNAISMFKRGNLPGSANMSEEVRDKVLMKMRYGGRTVQDLTEFCKKISNGENLSELSSDEDSDVDKQGNTKAFHHPFQVKEREPIVMHIRNATTLVPRKPIEDQTKAITMQFPVSSGQHHRLTEASWVPVEPREKLLPLPALPQATQATTIFKGAKTKNVFEKPIPKQAHQEPAFKTVPFTNDAASTPLAAPSDALVPLPTNNTALSIKPLSVPVANFNVPPPQIPKPVNTAPPPVLSFPPPFVPDVPVPSSAQAAVSASASHSVAASNSIFSDQQQSYDVATIITKRLNAMRRLQENPTDPEAIKLMTNSQQQMSSWASSKHLPGQFTGSTGAKVLSVQELNSGPQVWTRRNQMTATKPVTGGMGMHLLQKMGWKPGEGLGREKTGSLQPLLLDVKLDKRGLVSKEDTNPSRPQIIQRKRQNMQPQEDLQNKHPVSVLNEMSSKNRWQPPMYQMVNEAGPMHNKMFLFSVTMNGKTYTPDRGSSTKKEAKMFAARFCLQEMGLIRKEAPPTT